ncbi:hypothetical protein BDD21_0941 [Thiocapsa rosea]|uniref:Uncharacterized protein n=2 Tax=Thiocapsa rosea TaxID=69360 RepID=A0A495V2E7_9GAMM|nr:hypothetical protein BDD21_0941 [Thiocapsa rosea]
MAVFIMSHTPEASFSDRRTSLIFGLSLIGLILLGVIYFVPIWWVSLTAPNYPPESFPDGVRIHFHMNGVFNGCKMVEKSEITEDEALNCVHEMDTINHYVGMYPISAGGVVERAFAPFLLSMLGVMVVGFAIPGSKTRLAVMGAGFALIVGWMAMTFYTADGLKLNSRGYLSALALALDQETATPEAEKRLSPAEALIAQMKASLEGDAEPKVAPGAPDIGGVADPDKAALAASLRGAFERDQAKQPSGERRPWTGSGHQVLAWHYGKSLGRYFNNPEEIQPMVGIMSTAAHVVFWSIIGAMLVLLWGARRSEGTLYWLLILAPMALPLLFILDYSAWLWWYGHNMNAMGAFTVKPFMPTVFGDGKVAQFGTHSYPYWGFGLMLLLSAVLAAASLLRRKQLKSSP